MSTLPKSIERVVNQLLVDASTPRALTVRLLIEHEEWDQLLDLKVDPAHYTDAHAFSCDYSVTEFLRKCRDLPGNTEESRHAEALAIFAAAEKQCASTNVRFASHVDAGLFETVSDVRVHEHMLRVKRIVADVLRSIPKELDGRHGKGATFADSGQRATVLDKMSSRPTVTQDTRSLLPFWERTAWCRALMLDNPNRSDPEVVKGNRFTSVPKDAKKNRGICIEPSINIFFQLAIGGEIRRRLMDVGLDLDHSQDVHRQVACAASRSGRFCTIDLSSASDTVAKKLVEFLLPTDWYELLKAARSPATIIDGKTYWLEKFSSMGNGFTFELETLLFLALAMYATEQRGIRPLIGENVFVYGDDIIVLSEVSEDLLALLRYCGFTPNERKTFTKGLFRESCGGDFFDGVAVRPHYLKEFPNEPSTWIVLANGIRRVAAGFTGSPHLASRYLSAWFCALDNIPTHIRRLRGPEYFGDQVIHDVESHWRIKVSDCIRYVHCLLPMHRKIPLNRWDPGTQLAAALYGVPSDGVTPRGEQGLKGHRLKWLAFS